MNVNAAVRVLEFLDTTPVELGVCAALTPMTAIMGCLKMLFLFRASDPVSVGIRACEANVGKRHEKHQWVVSIRNGQAWLICAARRCHLQLPMGRPAFQINRSGGG